MSDPTGLYVTARGNHRKGYRGVMVVTFFDAKLPFECGHRHFTTREARDCIRLKVWRLLDAGEVK